MADKTIEIGLNAKLNVQTSGTESLETLKTRALAASDAIKTLSESGDDQLIELSTQMERAAKGIASSLDAMKDMAQKMGTVQNSIPTQRAQQPTAYQQADQRARVELNRMDDGFSVVAADPELSKLIADGKAARAQNTHPNLNLDRTQPNSEAAKVPTRLDPLNTQAQTLPLNPQAQARLDQLTQLGNQAQGTPSNQSLQKLKMGVQNLNPALAAVQLPSDAARLQARLDRLEIHAQQAQAAGHNTDKETAALQQAAKALDAIRERFKTLPAGGTGGGGIPPKPPTPPSSDGEGEPSKFKQFMDRIKNMYAQDASRGIAGGARALGGSGAGEAVMGGLGMLEGASAVLAPLAIGAAVITGFNAATNALTSANAPGRNELTASADLARQYGYSGNPNRLFRDQTGMSNPELLKYNYSARDAARVASIYDRPGNMQRDTVDILKFSRTTGLDESRVAGVARAFSVGGATNQTQNLETLKLALAEGLKLGISQSQTMQNMLSYAESNYRQGRTVTSQGVAYQASLLKALGDTGNPLLKGAGGASVAEKITNLTTGNGDLSQQLILGNRLGGAPSAKELNLTGNQAIAYEKLRKSSPVQALQMALEIAKSGRAPAFNQKLMEATIGAYGNDPSVLDAVLKSSGFSAEERLSLENGGLRGVANRTNANIPRYKAGQALGRDEQGKNPYEFSSRRQAVLDAESEYKAQISSVYALGGLEEQARSLRNTFRDLGTTIGNFIGKAANRPDPFGNSSYGGFAGQQTNLWAGRLPDGSVVPNSVADFTNPNPRIAAETRSRLENYLKTSGADRAALRRVGLDPNNPIPANIKKDEQRDAFLADLQRRDPYQYQTLMRVIDNSNDPTNVTNSSISNMGATTSFDVGEQYSAETRGKFPGLPVQHQGRDIVVNGGEGAPVKSPFNGVVLQAGSSAGYGNSVVLDLRNGYHVIFGHFQKVNVSKGQHISKGQVIGFQGSTGNATAPHVHIEIRRAKDNGAFSGQAITNPQEFDQVFAASVNGVARLPTSQNNPAPAGRLAQYAANKGFEPSFTQGVQAISASMGVAPNDLMSVIGFETMGSFSASENRTPGVMGLIQFNADAARAMGTTQAALGKMTRTQQLEYVQKYMNRKQATYGTRGKPAGTIAQAIARGGGDSTDLYTAVIAPYYADAPDSTTVYSKTGTPASRAAYMANAKNFDTNKDGKITKTELGAAITRYQKAQGLQASAQNSSQTLARGNATVTFLGLDNIKITGLNPRAAQQFQKHVKGLAEIAGNPKSYKGV